MERDDVTALLDVQRKVFNDVVDRMQREMKSSLKETDNRMSDTIKSLEYSQGEIADLGEKLKKANKEKEELLSQVSYLLKENEAMKTKMIEMKDRGDYMTTAAMST